MDNAVTDNEPADDVDSISETVENSPQPAAGASETATSAPSRGMRLAKLMGTHVLVFLVALSLFAAADSWSTITGLGIATLLSVITGALAGITISTLVHEWFHYAGARYAGAAFDIPSRQGLFLYDWDFSSNSLRQFLIMSVAGSVGGFVAVILMWNAVPADTWGNTQHESQKKTAINVLPGPPDVPPYEPGQKLHIHRPDTVDQRVINTRDESDRAPGDSRHDVRRTHEQPPQKNPKRCHGRYRSLPERSGTKYTASTISVS